MIARIWRGRAMTENAPHYRQHATQQVFPSLARLPGHRGAYLLTRETGDQVEFLAVTLWDTIDSVRKFAGSYPEVAVVEPEARALLSDFDDFARHYELDCASSASYPS
jgi:heme-degrading monooxygenase HmoA